MPDEIKKLQDQLNAIEAELEGFSNLSQLNSQYLRSIKNIFFHTENLIADDSDEGINTVSSRSQYISVNGTTNGVDDYIVLPSLDKVNTGYQFHIGCNAGSDFEMRTPSGSNEKINNVDSDGSNEHLMPDGRIMVVTKLSDSAGWVTFDVLGGGGTGNPIVPD